MRKKSIRRKIAFGLAGMLLITALVIVFLPTLVNLGLGRGRIEGSIASRLNGEVSIRTVGLSWFDMQIVEGLTIFDSRDETVANLDVHLEESLWTLLTSGTATLHLEVKGEIFATLDERGHLNLADLIKENVSADPDEPSFFSELEQFDLTVRDLDIRLHDMVADRVMTFPDFSGEMHYESGRPLMLDLHSSTRADDLLGSVAMKMELDHFLDATGAFAPGQARLQGEIDIESWPVLLVKSRDVIRHFHLDIASDNLSKHVELHVDGEATLQSSEPSRLTGTLLVEKPLTPAGEFNLGLESFTGNLRGTNVPTSLLQPLFAQTSFVLQRDLGSSVDVSADWSVGQSKDIRVTVRSENLEFDLRCTADAASHAVSGEHLELRMNVSPDLVRNLANVQMDRPLPLHLELTAFSIPSRDRNGFVPLRDISAIGSLRIELTDPISMGLADADEPLGQLKAFYVEFTSASLGEGVEVQGVATGDFGAVAFNERLTNLLDEQGTLNLAGVRPEGETTIDDIPGSILARFIKDESGLVGLLFDEPGRVVLNTVVERDEVHFTLGFISSGLTVSASGVQMKDGLLLEKARANVSVTPAMFAQAQRESELPIRLLDPTNATVELGRHEFPGSTWVDYDFWSTPIKATVTLHDATVEGVQGAVEPIVLRESLVVVTSHLADRRFEVKGGLTLQSTRTGETIGRVDAELSFDTTGDGTSVTGRLEVIDLSLTNAEIVMGRDANTWSRWLGPQGEVTIDFESKGEAMSATITPKFDRFEGVFLARLDDEAIELNGRTSRFLVTIGQWRDAENKLSTLIVDADQTTGMMVTNDISLNLQLDRLRLPRGLFEATSIDPEVFALHATLTSEAIDLGVGSARTSLDHLSAEFSGDTLAGPIEFRIRANPIEMTANRDAMTHDLDVRGRISTLLDEQNRFTPAGATLDLNVNVNDVSTELIDTLLGLDGLLVNAVGPTMSIECVARQFSTQGGSVTGEMHAPKMHMSFDLVGDDDLLKTTDQGVIEGEFIVTPELTQHALFRITPIIGDIRVASEPIRFTIREAVFPLDGDVSRLNADINIDIGQVQLDAGASSFSLLAIFDPNASATVPGEIEPIHARITEGVVTFDEFVITIDRYSFPFSGIMDLNRRFVDMRTQAPLTGLALSIRELRGIAPSIKVPILIRGPFGEITSEIDPDFRLEQVALDIGIFKLLTDVLGENDDPILRQLLGGSPHDSETVTDPLGDLLKGILEGSRQDKDDDKKREDKSSR